MEFDSKSEFMYIQHPNWIIFIVIINFRSDIDANTREKLQKPKSGKEMFGEFGNLILVEDMMT